MLTGIWRLSFFIAAHVSFSGLRDNAVLSSRASPVVTCVVYTLRSAVPLRSGAAPVAPVAMEGPSWQPDPGPERFRPPEDSAGPGGSWGPDPWGTVAGREQEGGEEHTTSRMLLPRYGSSDRSGCYKVRESVSFEMF